MDLLDAEQELAEIFPLNTCKNPIRLPAFSANHRISPAFPEMEFVLF